MADFGILRPVSTKIPVTSHETALCVVLPHDASIEVEDLRSLYDRNYGIWPPHVNLVYPFVAIEDLERAKTRIAEALSARLARSPNTKIALTTSALFQHRKSSTIVLQSNEDSSAKLASLRSTVLQALGQRDTPVRFHLTIGQPEQETLSSRSYLLHKAALIPEISVSVPTLAILIRDKVPNTIAACRMRLWETINMEVPSSLPKPTLQEYWLEDSVASEIDPRGIDKDEEETALSTSYSRKIRSRATYHYNQDLRIWDRQDPSERPHLPNCDINIASYNVLIDSEYPPAHERDPHLLDTILGPNALADILVLQEVSDDFLTYLLSNEDVQSRFPYVSHGPPDQHDIGPLPSLRNIVLLSKWPFTWKFMPFARRHKGALVAKFSLATGITSADSTTLVVAGVHLTSGLTDGSVAAKKNQLSSLIAHMHQEYAKEDSWIIAGDFNLATSSYTIGEAAKYKTITEATVRVLENLETLFVENLFVDAWSTARIEGLDRSSSLDPDDLFFGEEGFTFDPAGNALAAENSGTSRNRPQRYDRILFRSQEKLRVQSFNQFGHPESRDGAVQAPSDHLGVRTNLKIVQSTPNKRPSDTLRTGAQVKYMHADIGSSHDGDLATTLDGFEIFPSPKERRARDDAFDIIKRVVLDNASEGKPSQDIVSLVMVPVGSYALGVWTASSDIDCLCVGSISSITFFKLARQRIHRAADLDVRVLRTVEANSGTMLEVCVKGIHVDLQYCPAANVVQRWSDFSNLPTSDPIFNLSILSLRKLKPIRDLTYLKHTLPSMASFRLAYHFIKLWAVQRGLYSAKFGYLGGIHITMMLSWICKSISHDRGPVSAGDMIVTFFHHWSTFDWGKDMVYDAFFHKAAPRYQRSAREPMVVLGYHAPHSNIAHTATVPSLEILIKEMQDASMRLMSPGMTWRAFFDSTEHPGKDSFAQRGARRFLDSYQSYVKLDIQFWGRSLSQGRSLLGWLESRSIGMVVDIHKAVSQLTVRLWPARFTDAGATATDSYYEGCYLIGLDGQDTDCHGDQTDPRATKILMQKTFDRFLSQVQADTKNYDPETSWVGLSVVKVSKVGSLTLDTREWGHHDATDEATDSEDEMDDDEEDLDEPLNTTSHPQRTHSNLPSRSQNSTISTPVSAHKLRPASEVLNRLRWDPAFNPSDYLVGYEDRFLGARESSLEKWKTEQTDEEFIPQHRILYFKRRGGGGEIIWERATRMDKIFGSGAGDGRNVSGRT